MIPSSRRAEDLDRKQNGSHRLLLLIKILLWIEWGFLWAFWVIPCHVYDLVFSFTSGSKGTEILYFVHCVWVWILGGYRHTSFKQRKVYRCCFCLCLLLYLYIHSFIYPSTRLSVPLFIHPSISSFIYSSNLLIHFHFFIYWISIYQHINTRYMSRC